MGKEQNEGVYCQKRNRGNTVSAAFDFGQTPRMSQTVSSFPTRISTRTIQISIPSVRQRCRPVVVNWGDSVPQGISVNVWRQFACHNWREGTTASGWRSGKLLNILQGTGRPHDKEWSGPKRPSCGGWEILAYTKPVGMLLIFFSLWDSR